MARLPTVGGDSGNWGGVLNEFLTEAHNTDGTLKSDISTQKVRVSKGGTLAGTRREINLVEGTGLTITAADDSTNNRVNVTLASTAIGGVSSVNTQTGDVVLTATDVGADDEGAAAAVAATAPAVIRYSGGAYASRGSVTSDTDRTVIWIGPSAPSIGGSGAINDVDVWWKTP